MRTLIALLLTGCFHAGVPLRSAPTRAPGDFSLGVTLTFAGLAASEGDNTAHRAGLVPMIIIPIQFFLLHNVVLDLRTGLAQDTELAFLVGAQAVGAELRRGIQHTPEAAMTLEAGAEWVPMNEGARLRLGARASNDEGWITGVYTTFGSEAHVENKRWEELVWGGADGIIYNELRVLFLAGRLVPSTVGEVGGGAVGHLVLWHGEPTGWPHLTSGTYVAEEWFGGHLILGGEFNP
jgi:hypothetical protein